MDPIDLRLKRNVKVSGYIFPTKDPEYLREDLLQIDLPTGVKIDVGWYPDGDPNGEYQIVVFRESWDDPLTFPVRTQDTEWAVKWIRHLAAVFSEARITIRCASSGSHYECIAPNWSNATFTLRPTLAFPLYATQISHSGWSTVYVRNDATPREAKPPEHEYVLSRD